MFYKFDLLNSLQIHMIMTNFYFLYNIYFYFYIQNNCILQWKNNCILVNITIAIIHKDQHGGTIH